MSDSPVGACRITQEGAEWDYLPHGSDENTIAADVRICGDLCSFWERVRGRVQTECSCRTTAKCYVVYVL
jgi:hypothetical protein